MGRYNFASTGAAAGDALTDVLARQREEARRDMLNEITRQNAEANRKRTEEDTLASQQQREEDLLANASKNWTMGQDISGVDPAILAAAKRRGAVSPSARKPVPHVSTQEYMWNEATGVPEAEGISDPSMVPGFSDPNAKPDTGQYFVGSNKERDEQRHIEKSAQLAAALQDPKLTPTQRMGIIMQAEAAGINVDSGGWSAVMRPTPKRGIYDSDKGVFKEAPDGMTDINVIPRTPRPPQGHAPVLYVAPDGKAYSYNPDNESMHEVKNAPTGLRRPGGTDRATAAKTAAQLVPPALLNSLTSSYSLGPGGRPQPFEKTQQAQMNVLRAFPSSFMSDDVRESVRQALQNEDPSTTYEEIIAHNADSFATPAEFEAFKSALALLRR